MKQIIRFGIVGVVGFVVDALILLTFVNIFLFDISISRFFSFLCAVFVTWIFNRNFTFSQKKQINKSREYLIYFFIQSIGAFLNYIIFISLVYSYTLFKEHLLIPLIISSFIAMFFNFIMIKNKVYK